MAKRTFKHFTPRDKPKKRPRRHKKNLNKNEIILISDPNNISNYNILKTENVGIETENDNDIWLSMLNIKILIYLNLKIIFLRKKKCTKL